MARADIGTLHDAILEDRDKIRGDLLGCLADAGRVERERLRLILSADRSQIYRTEGARNSAEFISALFHISKWKAQRWIDAARALDRLPYIAAALEAGSLSLDKTVELTRFATPEKEKKLLSWARRVTVGCIRQRGDEAIKASKEEIRNAHHNRELTWWWNDHSLFFEGSLPAEHGAALVEAVDRLAHELPEDPGSSPALFEGDEPSSMSERRADALFLLTTSSCEGEPSVPTVVVHVPAAALSEADGNGVTESGTVLDPELVRMLSCDSKIQAILEDPDGHPLGLGHETRIPSKSLRRLVLDRDGHACTFPGCGMKRFLHLHHIVHWPKGPTDYDNLVTVCKVHHDLVHKLGWTVSLDEGHATWHRPLGRRYEPGPPPPEPPAEARRRQFRPGEAAGYPGLEGWIALFARTRRRTAA